jgi:fatty acid desaturase
MATPPVDPAAAVPLANRRVNSPPDLPIPAGLNLFLTALVFALALVLLWLGSQVEAWYAVLAVGILFSYLLLSNYALLHEAMHNNLHPDSRVNHGLGMLTGLLFPVPFSLVHATHQGHHLRNRTDFEMFDLYYPTDNRLVKHAQLYSILCGLFWPVIPIGAVLFAICPALLRTAPFQKARSSSYLLSDIRGTEVRAIRFELLLIVVAFALLFWLLELRWQNTLVLYACFAVNWSTRQYVGHAFTKRDVVEGAWNLRHNGLMSLILLHGEYDLNHHRRPDLSWVYLPRLCQPDDPPRPGYVVQYLKLWLGPRPAREPAPESLTTLPLSIHDDHRHLCPPTGARS